MSVDFVWFSQLEGYLMMKNYFYKRYKSTTYHLLGKHSYNQVMRQLALTFFGTDVSITKEEFQFKTIAKEETGPSS